jgi:hypothetical protein
MFWTLFFATLVILGVGLLFWPSQKRRASALALDTVSSLTNELAGLLEFQTKLVAEPDFKHGELQHLRTTLLLQIAYIHDTLALIWAVAYSEPGPLVTHLVRIGQTPAYQWTDYVNHLTQGLTDALRESPTMPEELRGEVERMKTLLVESAHAVMPVRNKLAQDLRKAGIVWK